MQIRFKKLTPLGSIQFLPGELVDLPVERAQAFIDAGDAVAVPQAEFAALRVEQPRTNPAPRPAKNSVLKGRR